MLTIPSSLLKKKMLPNTNDICQQRRQALKLIIAALNISYPDNYAHEDYLIDALVRDLLSMPTKDIGKPPYCGINLEQD